MTRFHFSRGLQPQKEFGTQIQSTTGCVRMRTLLTKSSSFSLVKLPSFSNRNLKHSSCRKTLTAKSITHNLSNIFCSGGKNFREIAGCSSNCACGLPPIMSVRFVSSTSSREEKRRSSSIRMSAQKPDGSASSFWFRVVYWPRALAGAISTVGFYGATSACKRSERGRRINRKF